MLRSRGSLACPSPYTNNLAEPKVVNIRSICVGLPGIKQRYEPGFVTLRFSVSLIHDSFFRDKQYTIYSISSITKEPFGNTFNKKKLNDNQPGNLNSFRLGVLFILLLGFTRKNSTTVNGSSVSTSEEPISGEIP